MRRNTGEFLSSNSIFSGLAIFFALSLIVMTPAGFGQERPDEVSRDQVAGPEKTAENDLGLPSAVRSFAADRKPAEPASPDAETLDGRDSVPRTAPLSHFPRAAQTRPTDKLRVQISAYFWLPHVTGRVKPVATGPTMEIDTSISDVIRDSDGAVMLNGTFRKDRFVFLWDFNWSGSSKEGRVFVPIAGGIPADASAKIRQTSATLMAGASVLQRDRTTVDIMGGVRIWNIKAEVSATLPPPFNFASGSESWADPLAGIRLRQELSRKWSLILYGDAGGFSAGSRFTGQIAGTLNYQVTNHLYLSGGYRHLAVDYRKNNRLIDLNMSGPVIGVTWAF